MELKAKDGTLLYGSLLKPASFDAARRYPVIVSVYGGPHAQTVTNSWGHVSPLDSLLASRGFLVFKLDNRGMAARGTAFEFPVHLEKVELEDQLVGLDYLKSLPYVDPARVGITGWSYGGYLTLYALTHAPGVFKAGVAGAPVTDWKHYDTIYTERYMGTPEGNPKGYESSSPLQKAGALEADLLLIHGASDDNVHLANTLAFVAALVKAGKSYELQVHPGQLHGFRAKEDRVARDRALVSHFERTLKPAASGAFAPTTSASGRNASKTCAGCARPTTSALADQHLAAAHCSQASAHRRRALGDLVGERQQHRSTLQRLRVVPGHERRERAPVALVLVSRLAHCGGEQGDLPVRKAGKVGREHQVRDVLVAIEEVDRAPDVEDARGLQQRVLQLGCGPGLERLVERAGELLAPLPALPRPAHEARRERVERAVLHARHRLERVARPAERQTLPHALARHHDTRGVAVLSVSIGPLADPGDRRSGPVRARFFASAANRRCRAAGAR